MNSIKKYILKNSFQETSKDFIKNDFELMISIYLFIYKKRVNLFSQFHLYSIFKKKLFTFIVSKEFITKFQFGHKNYFTCFKKKKKKLSDFLQFYLQKYFDSFSF